MHDARDAEDRRLLENGERRQLVENYYGVVIDRCKARVPAQDAFDVASNVVVRLLDELARGRTYRVPFRVVVHMVTTWKIKEYYAPEKFSHIELDERLASDDPLRGLENELDFQPDLERFLDGLPPRAREVALLRVRDDLEPEEIATKLAIDRNAVDQAWHRAKTQLLERVSADGS
jgi:RNA polymerase sigma factor (sigma-70 family)